MLIPKLLAGRSALAAEHLALRHQLAGLQRSVKRPRLRRSDRGFRVWSSRLAPGVPHENGCVSAPAEFAGVVAAALLTRVRTEPRIPPARQIAIELVQVCLAVRLRAGSRTVTLAVSR